jgi:hypothetical protein
LAVNSSSISPHQIVTEGSSLFTYSIPTVQAMAQTTCISFGGPSSFKTWIVFTSEAPLPALDQIYKNSAFKIRTAHVFKADLKTAIFFMFAIAAAKHYRFIKIIKQTIVHG